MDINIDNSRIKIDTYHSAIIENVYNGVTILTNQGKSLNICLRDWGFEMNIDGGEWFYIESEKDICCVTCQRKKKLLKLENNE